MVITFYDFCHILFVRRESSNPANIQEERITQVCKYQEVGISGAISEAAYQRVCSILTVEETEA